MPSCTDYWKMFLNLNFTVIFRHIFNPVLHIFILDPRESIQIPTQTLQKFLVTLSKGA